MAQMLRKKLVWITLGLYWPFLFVLTHIPVPKAITQAQISDKILHFTAYFLLVFLFWGAIKPYEKVNWKTPTPWKVLMVIVWYGVLDEWLQGFVAARSVDVHDFYADLFGALAGLFILTLLKFWPALLSISALGVFGLTISFRNDITDHLPKMGYLLYIFYYGFFTGLWILCMAKLRRDGQDREAPLWRFIGPLPNEGIRWFLCALSLPVALVLTVKLGAISLGKPFATPAIITALITIVVSSSGALVWGKYGSPNR